MTLGNACESREEAHGFEKGWMAAFARYRPAVSAEGSEPWLTGEYLYERAKQSGAPPWSEQDAEGKAIWRDTEKFLSDRLAGLPSPSISVSDEAVEKAAKAMWEAGDRCYPWNPSMPDCQEALAQVRVGLLAATEGQDG